MTSGWLPLVRYFWYVLSQTLIQIFNLPKAQNNGHYPRASESAAWCMKLILLSVSTYNFSPVQKDSWLQGVLEKEEGSLPTGTSSPGFPFCSLRSPKAGWNGIETLPFPREADSNQTSSCVSPSFSKHMVWHRFWNNLDRVIRKLNCSEKGKWKIHLSLPERVYAETSFHCAAGTLSARAAAQAPGPVQAGSQLGAETRSSPQNLLLWVFSDDVSPCWNPLEGPVNPIHTLLL